MKKHEVNIIVGRINSYQDAIYSVDDNIARIDKKKEGATPEREEELNRLCAMWERREHELISQDEYEKCMSAIDYARVDATVAYERLRQAYNKLADWCE